MTQLNPTSTPRALLLPLVLGALSAHASAGDLYVDDDLMEYPNAGYTSIQDAVDSSSSGDNIYVYPGTYTGTGAEVVKVDKEISLRAVTSLGEVIIDGQGWRRCLTALGRDADTTTDSIAVSNFTIVNGLAQFGQALNSEHGGGIYAEGFVSIKSCKISSCHAQGSGGGLAIFNPSLYGGTTNDSGIDVCPYTLVWVWDSVVENCLADGDGGGVWNWESEVDLVGADIQQNGAYGRGGGIAAHHWYTENGATNLKREGGTDLPTGIWANTAEGDGGGIFCEGNKGILWLEKAEIVGNRALAGDGGGACLFNARARYRDAMVAHNDADQGISGGHGGGIAARASSISHSNYVDTILTLFENTADSGGGGIYAKASELELNAAQLEGNQTLGKGGGMAIISCVAFALEGCTFLENIGRVAGGLYLKNTYGTLTDSSVLYNQGFFNGGMNGAGVAVDGGGAELVISGTNFWQNTKKHYLEGNGGVVTDGLGNLVQP